MVCSCQKHEHGFPLEPTSNSEATLEEAAWVMHRRDQPSTPKSRAREEHKWGSGRSRAKTPAPKPGEPLPARQRGSNGAPNSRAGARRRSVVRGPHGGAHHSLLGLQDAVREAAGAAETEPDGGQICSILGEFCGGDWICWDESPRCRRPPWDSFLRRQRGRGRGLRWWSFVAMAARV